MDGTPSSTPRPLSIISSVTLNIDHDPMAAIYEAANFSDNREMNAETVIVKILKLCDALIQMGEIDGSPYIGAIIDHRFLKKSVVISVKF
jgi:hypothetical protein